MRGIVVASADYMRPAPGVFVCLQPEPNLTPTAAEDWPPINGRGYVKSEEFGKLLLQEIEPLRRRYGHLDFSDAAAKVFIWMDGKLRKNRRLLNRQRFPTQQDFRAYVRRAVFNAAQAAQRDRQAQRPISEATAEVDLSLDPVQLAALRESVERLDEPHKTVLEKLFFEREDPQMLASILGKTRREVERLYGEALDLLRVSF